MLKSSFFKLILLFSFTIVTQQGIAQESQRSAIQKKPAKNRINSIVRKQGNEFPRVAPGHTGKKRKSYWPFLSDYSGDSGSQFEMYFDMSFVFKYSQSPFVYDLSNDTSFQYEMGNSAIADSNDYNSGFKPGSGLTMRPNTDGAGLNIGEVGLQIIGH
jgi:hypothetical protein